MSEKWILDDDRHFDAEPNQRAAARELYSQIRDLPIVAPHGHVDPRLLADPDATLGTPADLFVIPDHYVFRMLYSRGVPMEKLGVPTADGTPVETDHRKIWQCFAENFHLFRGTPTGGWLADEMVNVFGVEEKLDSRSASRIYDHLESRLANPDFSPRVLLKRFAVETLCTTDAATDSLEYHSSLRDEGWEERVRPTFRPDAVTNLVTPGWHENVAKLSELTGVDVSDHGSFLEALGRRREFFRSMGAVATDHSSTTPYTERLDPGETEAIFFRALKGQASVYDAERYTAHMLIEFAAMSIEDGLVMQLHAGSLRDHNPAIHSRYGKDKGADIPVAADWTRGLKALLDEFGNDQRLSLILFTLDESTYSRELAPLAGHYPVLTLGAPWWFFDSPNGMRRYLDLVVETAGIYNTAGFNDDTRAFASIPARHDVWRRVVSDWLAGLLVSGVIDRADALAMAHDLAIGLAREAYGLKESHQTSETSEEKSLR